MNKILECSDETENYIRSLPKVYIIAYWKSWGVRECAFSGRFFIENGIPIPMVWNYDDHNGTCSQYELIDIRETTTGNIIDWSFSKTSAETFAECLNRKDK